VAFAILLVDVRTPLQQQIDHPTVSVLNGYHEQRDAPRPTIGERRIGITATVEPGAHHHIIAVKRCFPDRVRDQRQRVVLGGISDLHFTRDRASGSTACDGSPKVQLEGVATHAERQGAQPGGRVQWDSMRCELGERAGHFRSGTPSSRLLGRLSAIAEAWLRRIPAASRFHHPPFSVGNIED